LVLLRGDPGCGRTTLAEALSTARGGVILKVRDLYVRVESNADALLDEQALTMLDTAISQHDLVIFDDFDDIVRTLHTPYGNERAFAWASGMKTLLDRAKARGKTFVLTGSGFHYEHNRDIDIVGFLKTSGANVTIPALSPDDYRFFIKTWVAPDLAEQVDVGRLLDHASKLGLLQLKALAAFVNKHRRADEAFVRDMVDQRLMKTNTNTGEVENLSFADLKGFEHIAEQLKTYVINPLADDARFSKLGLHPKRGVLLYGPPGTGKTSVGRALARQMQGKFFLVDGAVVTDPSQSFYWTIKWIFESAKRAAPSVVFIDDADVLFQSDRGTGLGRYLLTMLDGLESETAGKVAVILTAMNPNHLPPALLRSGRVELWLETKAPAQGPRAEMLAKYLGDRHGTFADYDPQHGARLSEGFTAADMRRLAMDVKAFYARDILADKKPAATETYIEQAVADIHHARALLARANAIEKLAI
jgi:SpoVK/Ycf46/Vps4 family AAA+-type ATPase